jgi:hypothetical protein
LTISAAAVALAGLNRRDEARPLVEDELTRARAFGAASTLGTSLHAAALVKTGPP